MSKAECPKLCAQGQGSQRSSQRNVEVLARLSVWVGRKIQGRKENGVWACQVSPIISGVIWHPGPVQGSHKDPGFIIPIGRHSPSCCVLGRDNPGGRGASTQGLSIRVAAVGSNVEVGWSLGSPPCIFFPTRWVRIPTQTYFYRFPGSGGRARLTLIWHFCCFLLSFHCT